MPRVLQDDLKKKALESGAGTDPDTPESNRAVLFASGGV